MSRVNSRKWLIDRRTMLRGTGISLALPMLDCMVSTKILGQDHPTHEASFPRRSVFVYIPNGVNTLTWQIRQAGTDYQMPESLQPLERHRQRMTPISGLHHPNGIGHAHRCDQIWLTGSSLDHGSGRFRNSISVDQVMAQNLGHKTRFPSLELSVTGGTLAWSPQGTPIPAERKPSLVFERLFGVQPGGVEQAGRELKRRRSVLDVLVDDTRRFRNSIGYQDQLKLDEYLASVRDVELRTQQAEAWLSTPKPTMDPKTRTQFMKHIPLSRAGELYRTFYDLMVLALQTDSTRVITCMSGSEGQGLALPEIGIRQTRHELSHHNGDPVQMARLTRCDQFLAEQFAYFLDRLNTQTEQGDTLLNRSMVLFGSGMSYGHSHGNANLPTILAGGASLGFQHGSHLDFNLPIIGNYDLAHAAEHYRICTRPANSEARLNNLLLSMLQGMGISTPSFGDSTQSLLAMSK